MWWRGPPSKSGGRGLKITRGGCSGAGGGSAGSAVAAEPAEHLVRILAGRGSLAPQGGLYIGAPAEQESVLLQGLKEQEVFLQLISLKTM